MDKSGNNSFYSVLKRSYYMKKTLIGFRVILGVCAALGWWGLIYPELSLTPDTYCILREDGTVQPTTDMVEWKFDNDIYLELLEAKPGQIRIKSKLFQSASDYLDYFLSGKTVDVED